MDKTKTFYTNCILLNGKKWKAYTHTLPGHAEGFSLLWDSSV